MNKDDVFDLYTDYLVTSFSHTTATGLSKLLEGEISHDQVTRFLSSNDFTSKELWNKVKKDVRKIEDDSEGPISAMDSSETMINWERPVGEVAQPDSTATVSTTGKRKRDRLLELI